MNTPEKKLSESLLQACKAAGIEKPKHIAQDKNGDVMHYTAIPVVSYAWDIWNDHRNDFTLLDHPPYATDWQESLLTWVEPCVNYVEDKSICDSYGEPKGQCLNCGAKDYEHEQGEPLADVLARHPESFTIETERNDDGEVAAHFVRDHHGDITEMIRPEHVADTSKMIPSGIEAMVCDDIAKRQQVGIAKYGTTVAENPLSHMRWLQHAYEECLDMAIYLKRAMAESDEAIKVLTDLLHDFESFKRIAAENGCGGSFGNLAIHRAKALIEAMAEKGVEKL